ncbi:MAG: glycosyltransferase family 4 protein [Thermoanaerobaculaceae bacterium]|nr:glycosyltransferase family 4 protein [Thermoanaerobaculaceae bacterium]
MDAGEAVKVLLVASRFPWPPHTGDRVRAVAWLEAMAGHAEVTLVAPRGTPPAGGAPCAVVTVPSAPGRLLGAAMRVLRRGLPWTSLLPAGHAWKRALRAAELTSGPFDASIVQLARLDPWVFAHLPPGRRILDAIDALGANLEERASAANGLARAFWRREAARTARLEAECGRRYDAVSVVAAGECAAFGERAVAIPHGVVLGPEAEGPRDIDLAFWGRLAYFANADAARFLIEEIWPLVRASRPGCTLLIGGADAPGWLRNAGGRDGITVQTPLVDREATLRRVRVAVVPLRFGTGMSNKVLEAADASCAVVSTPEGVRGLPDLAAEVAVGRTAQDLAARVLELLQHPEQARNQGRRLRQVADSWYSRASAGQRLLALVRGEPEAGSSWRA